jgi:hypothetical protein
MRQAAVVNVFSVRGERLVWSVLRGLHRVRDDGPECFVAQLPTIYTHTGARAQSTPDGYELGGELFLPVTPDDRLENVLARFNRMAREQGIALDLV